MVLLEQKWKERPCSGWDPQPSSSPSFGSTREGAAHSNSHRWNLPFLIPLHSKKYWLALSPHLHTPHSQVLRGAYTVHALFCPHFFYCFLFPSRWVVPCISCRRTRAVVWCGSGVASQVQKEKKKTSVPGALGSDYPTGGTASRVRRLHLRIGCLVPGGQAIFSGVRPTSPVSPLLILLSPTQSQPPPHAHHLGVASRRERCE